jgi:16S rRNA (guanine966-N2)-methyltransferase
MELVKGAIFSSLHDLISGARVLDLFAGSGSLGIEALSLGAASATFVEADRFAVECIEQNLAKTRFTGDIKSCDVFRYLERMAPAEAFDLVMADPPYVKDEGDRDFATELLASPHIPRTITSEGIFILEHLPWAPLPPHPAWELIRDKRYGKTSVAFFRKLPLHSIPFATPSP